MQNKIDKKYYVWIWLGLIFACFVRNIFTIYMEITSLFAQDVVTRLEIFTSVVSIIIGDGLIPCAVIFFVGFVLYYILARRHVNYISRNDFCYWIMIFSIAPKLITGIVESFAILNSSVYIVTSTLFEAILAPASFLVMYLVVFLRQYRFNPVEKYNSFSTLATIYMIFYGIGVLSSNFTIVAIGNDPQSYALLMQEIDALMSSLGLQFVLGLSEVQIVCSWVAIFVFVAYLVAVIVLSSNFKKQALQFRNADTREDFYRQHPNYTNAYTARNDVFETFDEFGEDKNGDDDDKDDNVFDEFDI